MKKKREKKENISKSILVMVPMHVNCYVLEFIFDLDKIYIHAKKKEITSFKCLGKVKRN